MNSNRPTAAFIIDNIRKPVTGLTGMNRIEREPMISPMRVIASIMPELGNRYLRMPRHTYMLKPWETCRLNRPQFGQ